MFPFVAWPASGHADPVSPLAGWSTWIHAGSSWRVKACARGGRAGQAPIAARRCDTATM